MRNVKASVELQRKRQTYAGEAAMFLFLAFVHEAHAALASVNGGRSEFAIVAALLSLCCIAIMTRAVYIWRLKALAISLPFAILACCILLCAIIQSIQ